MASVRPSTAPQELQQQQDEHDSSILSASASLSTGTSSPVFDKGYQQRLLKRLESGGSANEVSISATVRSASDGSKNISPVTGLPQTPRQTHRRTNTDYNNISASPYQPQAISHGGNISNATSMPYSYSASLKNSSRSDSLQHIHNYFNSALPTSPSKDERDRMNLLSNGTPLKKPFSSLMNGVNQSNSTISTSASSTNKRYPQNSNSLGMPASFSTSANSLLLYPSIVVPGTSTNLQGASANMSITTSSFSPSTGNTNNNLSIKPNAKSPNKLSPPESPFAHNGTVASNSFTYSVDPSILVPSENASPTPSLRNDTRRNSRAINSYSRNFDSNTNNQSKNGDNRIFEKIQNLKEFITNDLNLKLQKIDYENDLLTKELSLKHQNIQELNRELDNTCIELHNLLDTLNAKDLNSTNDESSQLFNKINELQKKLNVSKEKFNFEKSKINKFESDMKLLSSYREKGLINRQKQNLMIFNFVILILVLIIVYKTVYFFI